MLNSVPSDQRVVVEWRDVDMFVPVLVIGEHASPDPGTSEQTNDDVESGGKPKPKQGAKKTLVDCFKAATPDAPKERMVLYKVSGCADPGELLALMGPSGSGKSSLLQAVGGRSAGRPTGSMTFNGKPLSKAMKRRIGYVAQDDLLFAALTVYETLFYAAMLQLPQNWSKQEKIDRANMVIDCLGLDKCRDTIIGDQYMRGVSGGERKRVSIGHELLTNPSVILLDEPTSGLDSTTALKLMHTLRMLASGGRSIVTSIHQPSSRLYQQCDKLLLLAEGKTVYYGDAHVAPHWFARYGQPVPFGVSTSDHILDIACGDLPGYGAAESREIRISMVQRFTERTVGTGRSGILPADLGSDAVLGAQEAVRGRLALNASLSRDNSSAQASAPPVLRGESAKSLRRVGEVELGDGAGMGIGSVAETDMLEGGDGGTSGDSTGTSTAHTAGTMGKHVVDSDAIGIEIGDDGVADQQDTGADQKDEEEHTGPEGKVWGASWIDQVRYLSSRSVKTRRFSALSWQRVCETVIVGVLSGLFWFQLGATTLTPQVALDLGGVLFFEMLFLSFTALFQAIFNYPSEFSMVVKERQSGMYRLSAYYISRSLSDLPMDCLLPTILSIIIYFMAGLRLEPGAFFSNWWAVLLSVLIAQSAGLLIGASLKNVKNCLAVATVSMLIFMLVGGFYVRSMPVWIGWLKYCSFIYWGWNLLLKIEFSGRDMDPSACNGIDPCGVAASGTFPIDVNEPVTKEVCILISMLIFLRLVTYHVLNVKTTFKQKSG